MDSVVEVTRDGDSAVLSAAVCCERSVIEDSRFRCVRWAAIALSTPVPLLLVAKLCRSSCRSCSLLSVISAELVPTPVDSLPPPPPPRPPLRTISADGRLLPGFILMPGRIVVDEAGGWASIDAAAVADATAAERSSRFVGRLVVAIP